MGKIGILLLGILSSTNIFAESYSVSDILNTEIKNKQKDEQSAGSELNKFCIYSSKYNPCYEQSDSKNGFLKWQEGQRIVERDRQVLYLGTNRLYEILKKDYGLESKVKCRIYNTNSIRDDLRAKYGISPINDSSLPSIQVLGEENQAVMRMDSSLNKDIFNDIMSVSMLNSPSLTEEKKKYYIYQFQQKHIAIEKSCGEKFMTAYNKYLDDYGKYTAEIQNKELAQQQQKDVDEEQARLEQKKLQEADDAKRKQVFYAQQQKEADKRAAWSECFKSNDYLIYDASNNIVNSIDAINTGNKLLKSDDANVKVGGVSDLNLRYRASSMITNGQEQIKKSFAEYKRVGGKASTPYQVQKIKDTPCRWE